MRIRNIFVSAVVRKLAYVLVALFLAWIGIGKAHADNHATRPEAYAHCISEGMRGDARVQNTATAGYVENPHCLYVPTPAPARYYTRCEEYNVGGSLRNTDGLCTFGPPTLTPSIIDQHTWTAECPPNMVWDSFTNTCKNPTCENASPSPTFGGYLGATTCQTQDSGNGGSFDCEFVAQVATENSGGFPGYVNWFPTGDLCDKENYECLAGYSKNSQGHCIPNETCEGDAPRDPETGLCQSPFTCPSGQHKEPATGQCVPDSDTCPYGQVKGPDGSCVADDEDTCPAGKAKGSDGTCKNDTDGDGTPDGEEDDGTFSGGEDCNTPPACTGDNIMCGQARIQWRIDCNTRKNAEIQGGQCESMPVCVGEGCDWRQHAILIMQWRTACASEKLLAKSSTSTGGDGTCVPGQNAADMNCNAQPDWTETGTHGDDGSGDPQNGADFVQDVGAGLTLEQGGFGWGEACPAPTQVDVFGATVTIPPTDAFCSWMQVGGWFVMLLAGLASLRLVTEA